MPTESLKIMPTVYSLTLNKMAAPMECIAYCNIPRESDFLSISSAYLEDTVILSCRRKILNVYNLSDQKSVKSWSLLHGTTLTSPVLWDEKEERFITVVNKRVVRFWGKDDNDFDKSKKKNSNTSIYKIMLVNGFSPVILFTNGKIDFLEKVKKSHENGILRSEEDKIYWCKAIAHNSQLTVLFTVLSEESVKLYTNKYDSINNRWNFSVEKIPYLSESTTLMSCDFCMNNNTSTVFFLWSDGQLSCYNIDSEKDTHSMVHKLPGSLEQGSLVALNDLHVAVVGLKIDKKEGLCIYDTKFGLMKSWQPLPEQCALKPQVCQVGDNLFVPCGTTVYRFKYKCHPVTVGSLLGSVRSSISTTQEFVPEHHSWGSKNKTSLSSQPSCDLPEKFSTLMKDPMKKASYANFRKQFLALVDEIKQPINHHWLETSHMTNLVQKLLGDKQFVARNEIEILINAKCIPMSVIGQLFECLVTRNEVNLLQSALTKLPNIPESCICKALSFFLQCEEKQLSSLDVTEEDGSGKGIFKQACPVSKDRKTIINKILCLPFSDVFLLESLRKVSFKDALQLLEYLCYLLNNTPTLQTEDSGPKLLQVVDWLSLVLDAHITQFVLSPDAHMSILKLQSIVNRQVRYFDGLTTLAALLEQFKAKSLLPVDKKIGQYCIEVLHVF
ncbi:Nucleolar protein 11 [Mactra antiquata]